jgi:hypothetical protein
LFAIIVNYAMKFGMIFQLCSSMKPSRSRIKKRFQVSGVPPSPSGLRRAGRCQVSGHWFLASGNWPTTSNQQAMDSAFRLRISDCKDMGQGEWRIEHQRSSNIEHPASNGQRPATRRQKPCVYCQNIVIDQATTI